MAQIPKNIELKLKDIDILTAGMTAEFVNAILDFLLFQRNQIPFVYKTYKYYVEKWDEDDQSKDEKVSFSHYQLQKQRSMAKDTKQAISNMRELIRTAFKRSKEVKCLRFLFGHNTFMPFESYTIHIPHASISKYPGDVKGPNVNQMNQTLLQLLTCEELYSLWSSELRATNVFLQLELLTNEKESKVETLKLNPKDVISQLPRSCKNIHFYLVHENDKRNLQCCKELAIYEDIECLSENTTPAKENDCLKESDQTTGWWQADVIVQGFKTPKCDLWST